MALKRGDIGFSKHGAVLVLDEDTAFFIEMGEEYGDWDFSIGRIPPGPLYSIDGGRPPQNAALLAVQALLKLLDEQKP